MHLTRPQSALSARAPGLRAIVAVLATLPLTGCASVFPAQFPEEPKQVTIASAPALDSPPAKSGGSRGPGAARAEH
jgi:hypothetical protein